MTTEEIKEGNRLIAEFMGWQITGTQFRNIPDNYRDPNDSENIMSIDDFDYHSSWDWLMPVVQKITKLTPRKGTVLLHTTMYEPIISAIMEIDIVKVFQSTSCYIKWYNSQPKQSSPE